MTIEDAVHEIISECERAFQLYPLWPVDPIHAAAIVAEESGELVQAALDHTYSALNHKNGNTLYRCRQEAIQTAAMAVRFLVNLEHYRAVNTQQASDAEKVKVADKQNGPVLKKRYLARQEDGEREPHGN